MIEDQAVFKAGFDFMRPISSRIKDKLWAMSSLTLL
jgi:hypothetical protein